MATAIHPYPYIDPLHGDGVQENLKTVSNANKPQLLEAAIDFDDPRFDLSCCEIPLEDTSFFED